MSMARGHGSLILNKLRIRRREDGVETLIYNEGNVTKHKISRRRLRGTLFVGVVIFVVSSNVVVIFAVFPS